MSTQFALAAEKREDLGKGASRRLRRELGLVPAVVYGAGNDPQSISLRHNEVIKSLESEAFYSQIIELAVDGKKQKVVLKDVQRHPFKPIVLHMDFLRIKAGEKITMTIPFHFVGDDVAPGVKQDGGNVSHLTKEAEISCLPSKLPEFIEVDVSHLGIDEVLHLSEVKVPEGVEFTALAHDNDLALVSIHKPRVVADDEEEGEDTASSEEEGNEEAAKDGEKSE